MTKRRVRQRVFLEPARRNPESVPSLPHKAMRTHRTVLIPLTLLLTVAPSAQQAEINPQPGHTVSVDFRGGTLTEFAASLRSAGDNVNIVVPENASKVKIPALVLRQTSVEAALKAVTQVVEPTVRLSVDVSVGNVPNVGIVGEPVYSVRVSLQRDSPGAVTTAGMGNQRTVRVFSLRNLTKPMPGEASDAALSNVKTILTAIDTGLAVAGMREELEVGEADTKALVRFHEDSDLLFVAGTHTQLRLVEEVLSNLERDAQTIRNAMKRKVPAEDSEATMNVKVEPSDDGKAQSTPRRSPR